MAHEHPAGGAVVDLYGVAGGDRCFGGESGVDGQRLLTERGRVEQIRHGHEICVNHEIMTLAQMHAAGLGHGFQGQVWRQAGPCAGHDYKLFTGQDRAQGQGRVEPGEI